MDATCVGRMAMELHLLPETVGDTDDVAQWFLQRRSLQLQKKIQNTNGLQFLNKLRHGHTNLQAELQQRIWRQPARTTQDGSGEQVALKE